MHGANDESCPAGPPTWLTALVGALALGRLLAGTGPAEFPIERPARAGIQLADAPARALQRLPGIGARRARDLVEARWRRGPRDPPLYLGDVAGLGPDVERRVRAWLERAGRGE